MTKKISTFTSLIFILVICIIGFIKFRTIFMNVLVIPAKIISNLRFRKLNIPNVLMYSGYYSLLSMIFSIIFCVCLLLLIIHLLSRAQGPNFYSYIIKMLIVMVISGAVIYSNFWAITKDKIYVSSPETLGSIIKYDYNDVSSIAISVDDEKGAGPVLKVDLIVNKNNLDLWQSVSVNENNKNKEVKDLIIALKTRFHTSVTVNKHGHTEYDKDINYLLN
ncbi:membrane protein [Clostridium acetobutylicum]|nr:membrane protein [Clostridium acetobutylicum]